MTKYDELQALYANMHDDIVLGIIEASYVGAQSEAMMVLIADFRRQGLDATTILRTLHLGDTMALDGTRTGESFEAWLERKIG